MRDKISPELRYALLLLFATRMLITPLCVLSRLRGFEISRFKELAFVNYEPIWLGIWGMWDSAWYLDIAKNWYSPIIHTDLLHYNQANYGFFPLYPLLMRLVGYPLGDPFLAGIIISNIALLIASVLLFRLVRLESDDKTAMRAIKYMFLFPTAFMLSAVLTESLALALALASFYFAKKRDWLAAGVCGFLLSLTRPLGFLAAVPLCYEYLAQRRWTVGFGSAYFALIPLGALIFMSYTYWLTGDPLAYVHNKQAGWGHHLSNPLAVLASSILEWRISYTLNGFLVTAALLLLLAFYRRLGFTMWLYGVVMIMGPLAGEGRGLMQVMGRYLLVAFPLYVALAIWAEKPRRDLCLTASLALLQILFMYLWASGTGIV